MQRRELIKGLSILPLVGGSSLPALLSASLASPVYRSGASIYASLGVRPVINGRGTITIIGGCRMLPEVEQAMHAATADYVEIDELMDAVGKRIGELTGTEWGLVSTGATGALIIGTTG